MFSTLRDFSPLFLHLCSGYCHKLGIKGPLKRVLLNELDSNAKAWWYGWTCKSIFHIISHWLVEHGDRMTRCGQYCHWFRPQEKSRGLAVASYTWTIGVVGVINSQVSSGSISLCFSTESTFILFCSGSARNLQEEEFEAVDHTEMTSGLCLSTHTCHNRLQTHCRKKGSV